METLLLIVSVALTVIVFFLGFLVVGTLRALGLLSWRLEQLEATTPRRLGRDGLKVGASALEFRLPSVTGGEGALSDFAGRRVLLVFTQSGCGPCHDIVPELNRIAGRGDLQVLVVNNGELDETCSWAAKAGVKFPVLVQEQFSQSKRYQVFATPFAFLVDEQGVIISKGIAGSRQHLGYVLAGADRRTAPHHVESQLGEAEKSHQPEPVSSKEASYV